MSFQDFKKLLNSIFPAELIKDDPDLTKSARMSEKEVAEIAQLYYENYRESSANVGQYIDLSMKREKLVWSIRYAPVDEDGFPTKSGHVIFEIDDEKGEVTDKFFSPY